MSLASASLGLPATRLRASPARRTTAARRPAVHVSAAAPRFGGDGDSSKLAWVCGQCGYVYKDASKPFEQLPSSWKCPFCGAPKAAFEQKEPAPNVFLPIAAVLAVAAVLAYFLTKLQ